MYVVENGEYKQVIERGDYTGDIDYLPAELSNYHYMESGNSDLLMGPMGHVGQPTPLDSKQDNWWNSSAELYEDMMESQQTSAYDPAGIVAKSFVYGFMSPFKRITEGKWYRRPKAHGRRVGGKPFVPQIYRRFNYYRNGFQPKKRWQRKKKRRYRPRKTRSFT